MGNKVSIDNMASEIMKGLEEYADLASDTVKKAVQKAGNTVRQEIKAGAPVDKGTYAGSWSVKKMRETSSSVEIVVYSRNRYQLAHLLEHGHAKRGGGRVSARVHIAPAEEIGIEQLEADIIRGLSHE